MANVLEGYESAEVPVITESNETDEWILDSGCTYHMCPNKHFFLEMNEFDGGKVMMGNSQQCNIKGIGSIKLEMDDGKIKTLSSVRYVLEHYG